MFLDLGTSWRWVVSFTLRPLYPQGKSPRYLFDREVGWIPEPVSKTWRKENYLPYWDLNSNPSVV
jgi:hypothetical protein